MARVNFRIDDKAKQEAEQQAASIGLDLSEYTRMLYKLDLSEMVRKAVERRNEKVRKGGLK